MLYLRTSRHSFFSTPFQGAVAKFTPTPRGMNHYDVRPALCSSECTRNVLPQLPTLSDSNRVASQTWHQYVADVYGSALPAGRQLDLNDFTFFYTRIKRRVAKPVAKVLNSSCASICRASLTTQTYEGSLWVGQDPRTPASQFLALGFFVRRAFASPSHFRSHCRRLEVSHVETAFHGGEHGVAWFFHTKGSGIYISCTQLPTDGRLVIHRSRKAFQDHEGQKWIDGMRTHALPCRVLLHTNIAHLYHCSLVGWSHHHHSTDARFPRQWMRENRVSMIVFTKEDFRNWMPTSVNPRTEIVVLLDSRNSSIEKRAGAAATACMSRTGLRLFTGFNGTRACSCDGRSKFLNCGLAARASDETSKRLSAGGA